MRASLNLPASTRFLILSQTALVAIPLQCQHDPIKLAALTHIDFESIHPFVDGNGRMGRLPANWALMKNGHPPIVITRGERMRYFGMLEGPQTKFAACRLVRFFKRRVGDALDFYLKRLEPA